MSITTASLAAIQSFLGELPRNDRAWSYTIHGYDGVPYVTRSLLPRVLGHRVLIHRIWRPDSDLHCHNHPWETAHFLIASGGYVEERSDGSTRSYRVGEVNSLNRRDFHRVTHVQPNTYTVGVVGKRVQDWGFLVFGRLVPHKEFFSSRSYVPASEGMES